MAAVTAEPPALIHTDRAIRTSTAGRMTQLARDDTAMTSAAKTAMWSDRGVKWTRHDRTPENRR